MQTWVEYDIYKKVEPPAELEIYEGTFCSLEAAEAALKNYQNPEDFMIVKATFEVLER